MLSMVIGDITIRFGELERALFTAMTRVGCADEGRHDDTEYFLRLIGEYKQIKSLERMLGKAKELFKDHAFEWISFEKLEALKNQRNAIHDAFMEEPDGSKIWQASADRKHRCIDYAELALLREATERMIIQINDGSLNYKQVARLRNLEKAEA